MKKNLLAVLLLASSTLSLVACDKNPSGSEGPELEGTAKVVAEASEMTLAELEAAAKAEMEASNDTFKVVGLTSTLKKALDQFCEAYDWMVSEAEAEENTASVKADGEEKVKAAEEKQDTVQAEADKRKVENSNRGIIYAIEEPETSQHFEHQRILIDALKKLSEQVKSRLIPTVTPSG